MSKERMINTMSFEGIVEERAQLPDGSSRAPAKIAIRQSYQYRDELKTTIIDVSCFGSDLNNLAKGDHVMVTGRISSREYKHPETGQTKRYFDFVTDRVMVIMPKEALNRAGAVTAAQPFGGDEIPF